jgi:hypothetical protein
MQPDAHDRVPFQRCQMKLRRIDKELHSMKFAGLRVWDKEKEEYIERIYDVHDSHQYAAFGHILSLIQDTEALAHNVWSLELHREVMNDIHVRRVVLFKMFHLKVSDELRSDEPDAVPQIDE